MTTARNPLYAFSGTFIGYTAILNKYRALRLLSLSCNRRHPHTTALRLLCSCAPHFVPQQFYRKF